MNQKYNRVHRHTKNETVTGFMDLAFRLLSLREQFGKDRLPYQQNS